MKQKIEPQITGRNITWHPIADAQHVVKVLTGPVGADPDSLTLVKGFPKTIENPSYDLVNLDLDSIPTTNQLRFDFEEVVAGEVVGEGTRDITFLLASENPAATGATPLPVPPATPQAQPQAATPAPTPSPAPVRVIPAPAAAGPAPLPVPPASAATANSTTPASTPVAANPAVAAVTVTPASPSAAPASIAPAATGPAPLPVPPATPQAQPQTAQTTPQATPAQPANVPGAGPAPTPAPTPAPGPAPGPAPFTRTPPGGTRLNGSLRRLVRGNGMGILLLLLLIILALGYYMGYISLPTVDRGPSLTNPGSDGPRMPVGMRGSSTPYNLPGSTGPIGVTNSGSGNVQVVINNGTIHGGIYNDSRGGAQVPGEKNIGEPTDIGDIENGSCIALPGGADWAFRYMEGTTVRYRTSSCDPGKVKKYFNGSKHGTEKKPCWIPEEKFSIAEHGNVLSLRIRTQQDLRVEFKVE